MRATDAGGRPWRAAALRLATQAALQKIPLHLELADLLVELGDEAGVIFLFVVVVTAKDAGCTFRQRLFPSPYLAGMDLKPASQFSRCLFTFERFQGYPGFE